MEGIETQDGETQGLRGGEMGDVRWEDGEMGRWGDGRWRDGEMERWSDWAIGRLGDGLLET